MCNHENKTYNVFISHNSDDKDIAREIGIYLTAEDINVWFDEWEIGYGESITERVNKGLENCTHFLLLWSEKAARSLWVKREMNSVINRMLAHKDSNIKVIPILLDETPLPFIIADTLAIKYTNGNERERYNVVRAITNNAPSLNLIQAIVKKYNEVIFDDASGDMLQSKVCPGCGSLKVNYQSYTDDEHDEVYYIATCKKCGWSDWTQ